MFGATKESCLQTRTLNLHFSRLWHVERGNHCLWAYLSSTQHWNLTLNRNGLLPIHLKWSRVHYFGIFEVNFSVKWAIKSNLRDAYYFMAFMLDEWEVRSYAIIPSLILVSSPNMRNKLSWEGIIAYEHTLHPNYFFQLFHFSYETQD